RQHARQLLPGPGLGPDGRPVPREPAVRQQRNDAARLLRQRLLGPRRMRGRANSRHATHWSPVTRRWARAGPKPDAVTRAQTRAGPKPDAVTRAQTRAGPNPDAVTRAQTRAGPKPDAVTRAQTRAGPKPDAVTRAHKAGRGHPPPLTAGGSRVP